MGCNTLLPNFGSGSCQVDLGEIKRFMFTSYKKEDNTINSITLADAAAIANWQTLFDKPNFSDSVLEKVVPTDIVFGAKQENGEDVVFEENGFFEKLANGDVKFTAVLNTKVANYIKKVAEMTGKDISMYTADTKNQVGGESDGTNLIPLRIQPGGMSVTVFKARDRETSSQSTLTIMLSDPKQMNDFDVVEVTDGNVMDDSDFYSLIDATCTISGQVATKCTVTLLTKRYTTVPVSGITVVASFEAFDAVAPTLAIPATIVSETGSTGVYEVTVPIPAATYTMEVTHDTFDIDVSDSFVVA